jgi:hypothetical protein
MVWPSVKLDKMASPRAASMPQLSLGSTLRNFFSANDKCALTGSHMVGCGCPALILIVQVAQFAQEGSMQKNVVVLNDVETCIISLKNEQ